MSIKEAGRRLNTEINILSYMIHYWNNNVEKIVSGLTRDSFMFEITADIFNGLTDINWSVERAASKEELMIYDMCFDDQYASCGFYAFELDVQRLKKWNREEIDNVTGIS